MVAGKKLAQVAGKIRGVNDDEKADDTQKTDLLSKRVNSLAGSNIAVEPAFIEVGVRKHDVALAVDYVALPFLESHGPE